jgi:hypothetical protein
MRPSAHARGEHGPAPSPRARAPEAEQCVLLRAEAVPWRDLVSERCGELGEAALPRMSSSGMWQPCVLRICGGGFDRCRGYRAGECSEPARA